MRKLHVASLLLVSGFTFTLFNPVGAEASEVKKEIVAPNSSLNTVIENLVVPKEINRFEEVKAIEYLVEFEKKVKKEYTVKRGDNLTWISEDYGVTVEDIIRWNNLRSTELAIGQKLIVKRGYEKAYYTETLVEGKKIELPKLRNVKVVGTSQETDYNKKKEGKQLIDKEDTAQYIVEENQEVKDIYEEAIAYAEKLLGVPYVFGGTSETGIDCSGYVYLAYLNAGVDIDRLTAWDYYNMSVPVDEPMVGDLVFFKDTYKKGISHIGFYYGDGKMINAGGDFVHIADIHGDPYWNAHFVGYGRLADIDALMED